MKPQGPAAWRRPFALLRPRLATQGSGPQRRGSLRGAFLGASSGFAAAAGCSALTGALGRLQPVIAAAGVPASGGSGPQPGQLGHPRRRATDVLLVANVLLYGLQLWTHQAITVWGVKANPLVAAGQWWRLLTPAFLHANLAHLAVNSYSLNNLGPPVEAATGAPRFVLVYLAAAFAGNLASFWGSPALSLGASGAIFGVGGALAMHYHRNRDVYGRRSELVLRQLWQTLLINLVYGLSNPRIDNWGHMGGMVGGALAALLLGPRWVETKLPGRRGLWLVDRAPLPWLRSEPRQVSRW